VLLHDGHEIDFEPRKGSRSDQAPERRSVRGVGEEVERNGIVLRVLAGIPVERARLLVVSAQREVDGRLSEFVAGMPSLSAWASLAGRGSARDEERGACYTAGQNSREINDY
jgi:hypothetical protein